MMFLQKGEALLGAFPARLRHGKADIHVSNMRVLVEEYKLGCILSLDYDMMDSCTLREPAGKKRDMVVIYHKDGRHAELYSEDAAELAAMINSGLASYKSALLKIGAITADAV